MLIFSDEVATVLLVLVATNFYHCMTDLHVSKLITTVLTFRDVSKFASVNTAMMITDTDNDQLNYWKIQWLRLDSNPRPSGY